MKALAAGLALWSGAAGAACVEGPISAMDLADGTTIAVTGREGDRIATEHLGLGITQLHWQGLIPLSSVNRQARHEWRWPEPLPDLTALQQGAVLQLSGSKTFNGTPDGLIGWTIRAEGQGTDTIAGCDYPVQLLRVEETFDGSPRSEAVYHLHTASGVVLGIDLVNLFTGEVTPDMPVAVE